MTLSLTSPHLTLGAKYMILFPAENLKELAIDGADGGSWDIGK